MTLDEDACYQAMISRDPRFDGHFYIAVKTTGVYCRPVCPAPDPRRQNVRFLPSAAAAEREGFRPCLRCRPESAPGTAAWQGSSHTVTRALKLIETGFLDEGSVVELAEHLGVTARHLRRLFEKHLGASPVSVATTRRLHFAKRLLSETALPVTEVAYSSGFSSLRRFNVVFKEAYGRPPTAIRRADAGETKAPTLSLLLGYRPPFDWQGLLGCLRGRAVPGVERVDETTYARTVTLGGKVGIVTVSQRPERHQLRLDVSPALAQHLMALVERVKLVFDLTASPREIAEHLERDGALCPLPPLRLPGAWDGLEFAIRTILERTLTREAATALLARLVRIAGLPMEAPENSLTHLFPTAAAMTEANLAAVGLPDAEADSVRALTRAVREGRLSFECAADLATLTSQLCALPGVDARASNLIAMHAFGEPDAFPVGDASLGEAFARLSGSVFTEEQLACRAEAWRPWRAYAALAIRIRT